MKILHKNSPKAGQIEHLPPLVAQTLIAAGFAEAVPYKNYQERLREEGQGMRAPDPNFVVGVSWAVRQRLDGIFYIERRSGSEVMCGGPDTLKDIPAAILKQYRDKSSNEQMAADAARVEKDKAAAANYLERSKTFRRY